MKMKRFYRDNSQVCEADLSMYDTSTRGWQAWSGATVLAKFATTSTGLLDDGITTSITLTKTMTETAAGKFGVQLTADEANTAIDVLADGDVLYMIVEAGSAQEYKGVTSLLVTGIRTVD